MYWLEKTNLFFPRESEGKYRFSFSNQYMFLHASKVQQQRSIIEEGYFL